MFCSIIFPKSKEGHQILMRMFNFYVGYLYLKIKLKRKKKEEN